MSDRRDLASLSQRELEDYLDELVRRGEDERDTPEWRRAYAFWEKQ